MVLRFSSQHALLLASLAVGCGPEFQASFSPLSEAGAPADDDRNSGAGTSVVGNAGANSGGSGGAPLGGSNANGNSAGSAIGGSTPRGGSDSAGGGGGSRGTDDCISGGTSASAAGQGGGPARRCDALAPWAARSYTLGEHVTSICKAPYNGTCAANSQFEFECQPPTGAVGLGWCSVRQPGVGNGWHEAWRLTAACE